jgi:hypothetical protein
MVGGTEGCDLLGSRKGCQDGGRAQMPGEVTLPSLWDFRSRYPRICELGKSFNLADT